MQRRHCIKETSGTVLVTALVTLMFVALMGSVVLAMTVNGLRLTQRVKDSTLAFNYAESGVSEGVRWIKKQGSPPSNKAAFEPFTESELGEGTYSVSIVPDPGNAGATLKKYKLLARGKNGSVTETVEVVVRQASFGKYAYFTDRETSDVSGGRIWFFSGDRIRGPAHSNNRSNSDFQINWGGEGPIFQDIVTSASTSLTYSPKGPSSEEEFNKVFLNGSKGYRLNVDPIELPSSSDMQKSVAWASTEPYPMVKGVYVNSGGGIFVQGDCTMKMSVDVSGRQQFHIMQGSTETVVTVDPLNNRTAVQVGTGAVNYVSPVCNGVVYCQGSVTGLSGTIADNIVSGSPPNVQHRSAFTIATDVNAGGSIYLSGPLLHRTPYDPAKGPGDPANAYSGTVGLFGRNVKVAKGAPTGMEIDAIILAGSESALDGSFGVEDYSSKKPTGTLRVMGGIIQKARGAVGTISGGSIKTGYAKDYWYDARLADDPPPYFPTTGGYDVLSWRRLPQ